MKEFTVQLADLLSGFPPILTNIFAAAAGSLCVCIVLILREKSKSTAPQVLGRFVVGWVSGCFVGPLIAPGFQAIAKISEGTVSFLSGAGGYAFVENVIPKKIEKITNDPDEKGKPETPA